MTKQKPLRKLRRALGTLTTLSALLIAGSLPAAAANTGWNTAENNPPRVAERTPAPPAVAERTPAQPAVAERTAALSAVAERTPAPQNAEFGTGKTIINSGHVDFGPVLRDGKLQLLIRDDTQHPAVWRDPADVVLVVSDAAKTPAPADSAYSFLAAAAGSDLWVLPQTQQADIVWPGWNTQHETLLAAVSGGTTMRLEGVNGPGRMHVFVQEGNFGAPKSLFDSAAAPQEIWVDYNTHAHANWVFDKPGVYGVQFAFSATANSGETLVSSGVLQFAVGDSTAPDSAFGAPGVAAAAPANDNAANDSTTGDSAANDSAAAVDHAAAAAPTAAQPPVALLIGGGVLIAALIVLLLGLAIARQRRRTAVLNDTVAAGVEQD